MPLLFKPGDIVKLLPGYTSKSNNNILQTGVTVKESKMIRRTPAFTYEENPLPDKWFKQKHFVLVEDTTKITIERLSPWDTMSEENRKLFTRKIIGCLFRDKSAYEKINKIINH